MNMPVQLGANSYSIVLQRNALVQAGELLSLDRRVLIVTDDGVPPIYSQTVAAQCKTPTVVTLPAGEDTKSFARLEQLCCVMLAEGFTRTDCVVAVGGGVVGDLAGFAAACFMRGIDFYNCPTTLLSQVDSSIGGKTAVNVNGIKNCVGAFYQPKRVIIDPAVLSTLPRRHMAAGMAEAVKMAVTCDADLFAAMERQDPFSDLETVITRAIDIKRRVVEQDEKEAGLRRVLNFGHTIGHAIESLTGLGDLLHGECVALGMLPMCAAAVRPRLKAVLDRVGLPTELPDCATEELLNAARHDKKADGEQITITYVPAIGQFEFRKISLAALADYWEGRVEA